MTEHALTAFHRPPQSGRNRANLQVRPHHQHEDIRHVTPLQIPLDAGAHRFREIIYRSQKELPVAFVRESVQDRLNAPLVLEELHDGRGLVAPVQQIAGQAQPVDLGESHAGAQAELLERGLDRCKTPLAHAARTVLAPDLLLEVNGKTQHTRVMRPTGIFPIRTEVSRIHQQILHPLGIHLRKKLRERFQAWLAAKEAPQERPLRGWSSE